MDAPSSGGGAGSSRRTEPHTLHALSRAGLTVVHEQTHEPAGAGSGEGRTNGGRRAVHASHTSVEGLLIKVHIAHPQPGDCGGGGGGATTGAGRCRCGAVGRGVPQVSQ